MAAGFATAIRSNVSRAAQDFPDGKAVGNTCGTRVGAHRTLCRALGPAKENDYALGSPKRYANCSLAAKTEILIEWGRRMKHYLKLGATMISIVCALAFFALTPVARCQASLAFLHAGNSPAILGPQSKRERSFLSVSTAANQNSLIDVPNVLTVPHSVAFEILYQVKGKLEVKHTFVTSKSSSSSVHQSEHQTRIDKDLLKTSIAASLDGGLSLGKGLKYSLGLKIKGSSSSEHSLSWTDISDYKTSMDLKSSEKETLALTTDQTISVEGNDGFIHSSLTIVNNGHKKVTVKNIRVAIVLADASNPDSYDVIESATLMDGQNVYPSQTCQQQSTSSGNTTNSTATTPGSPPAAKLQLDLLPGASEDRNIDFDCENTHQLFNWLRDPRIPSLRVNFTLMVDNKEVSQPVEIESALRNGVSLRLIDQLGGDHQYYVSASSGRVSVAEALGASGFSVETATSSQGKKYISKLNGRASDCPPEDLSAVPAGIANPDQGAWVLATPEQDDFNGDISSPAPTGTHFTVIFITRREGLNAMRVGRRIWVRHVPISSNWNNVLLADINHQEWPDLQSAGASNQAQNKVPLGLVTVGDVVTLRIKGTHTCVTQRKVDAQPFFAAPGVDDEMSRLLIWANAKVDYVDCTGPFSKLLDPPSPGSYGLLIDAGNGEINLDDLVPHGSHWFEIEPDGTVQVRFLVETSLAPSGTAMLWAITHPSVKTFQVGREITLPPPPASDSHTAATPGDPHPFQTAQAWAEKAPALPVSITELINYDIEGEVLAVPTGSTDSPQVHDLTASEKAAVDTANAYLLAFDQGQFSTQWDQFFDDSLQHRLVAQFGTKENWAATAMAPGYRNSLADIGGVTHRELKGVQRNAATGVLSLSYLTDHSRRTLVDVVVLRQIANGSWKITLSYQASLGGPDGLSAADPNCCRWGQ